MVEVGVYCGGFGAIVSEVGCLLEAKEGTVGRRV